MAASNASTERIIEAIGGLTAKVENIQRDIASADRSRADIYRGMEKLGQEMIRVNNSVKTVTEKVEKMEPVVDDYRKIRQNVNGGVVVIAAIGAVLCTAVGFILKDAWSWIVAHIKVG